MPSIETQLGIVAIGAADENTIYVGTYPQHPIVVNRVPIELWEATLKRGLDGGWRFADTVEEAMWTFRPRRADWLQSGKDYVSDAARRKIVEVIEEAVSRWAVTNFEWSLEMTRAQQRRDAIEHCESEIARLTEKRQEINAELAERRRELKTLRAA